VPRRGFVDSLVIDRALLLLLFCVSLYVLKARGVCLLYLTVSYAIGNGAIQWHDTVLGCERLDHSKWALRGRLCSSRSLSCIMTA